MKTAVCAIVILFASVMAHGSDGTMVYNNLTRMVETSGGSSSGGFILPDPMFWAPLNDPSNPLKLNKGTGALSFTRTSIATYVNSATGYIATAPDNVLRIESKGALIEGQSTNLLLYSRDMTNAVWVKTNMTAVLDQVGEDGTANSASSLLATNANATCLQALTQASNPFSGSISIKRLIGTGAVSITLDNGATWTDVTSSLSASSWYRALKENQTLANPTFGVRLTNSADKVAVDYAGVEQFGISSSRISTTTTAVTRYVDVLEFPTSGNVSGSVGSVVAIFDTQLPINLLGFDPRLLSIGDKNTVGYGIPLDINHVTNAIAFYDNSAVYKNGPVVTFPVASLQFAGNAYGGTTAKLWLNGSSSLPLAFSGTFPTASNARIGSDSGDLNAILRGHIQNLLIFNRALTDAEMQGITTQ